MLCRLIFLGPNLFQKTKISLCRNITDFRPFFKAGENGGKSPVHFMIQHHNPGGKPSAEINGHGTRIVLVVICFDYVKLFFPIRLHVIKASQHGRINRGTQNQRARNTKAHQHRGVKLFNADEFRVSRVIQCGL